MFTAAGRTSYSMEGTGKFLCYEPQAIDDASKSGWDVVEKLAADETARRNITKRFLANFYRIADQCVYEIPEKLTSHDEQIQRLQVSQNPTCRVSVVYDHMYPQVFQVAGLSSF